MTSIFLVGWGIGWFVARSEAGGFIRDFTGQIATALTRSIDLMEGGGAGLLGWRSVAVIGRFLAGVTHCAACCGFWIGLGEGMMGWSLPVDSGRFVATLATGVAVMGVNAVLDVIVGLAAATVERIQDPFFRYRIPEQAAPEKKP